MKIFILGFMGSGKSTIGKLLAAKMKINFIDLDKYIEQKTGKPVTEIFSVHGEQHFRALEERSLKEVLKETSAVIALGGGTPCFGDNMELILASGLSFFIDLPAANLAKRLIQQKNNRPLIRNLNTNELNKFIEVRLKERLPFYQKANHTISSEKKSIEGIVLEINKLAGHR